MDGSAEELPDGAEAVSQVLGVATSNGHHWIERFNLVCCRDCGIVRRADDKNKPCRGVVRVGLR